MEGKASRQGGLRRERKTPREEYTVEHCLAFRTTSSFLTPFGEVSQIKRCMEEEDSSMQSTHPCTHPSVAYLALTHR